MCLYGSGPAKVAETVGCSLEQAKEYIDDYFAKFPKLKKWLKESKEYIEANGYIYTAFGRKRRLKNVFSVDKGIASHEVRSGINALVQSVCSDVNLLATIDMHNAITTYGLDARIFMLVHDSIVAEVAEKDVERYCRMLKDFTQKDRGVSIPGAPIGVDQDVGDDYSFGHFEEVYGAEFNTWKTSLSSVSAEEWKPSYTEEFEDISEGD
jgi:DNA polymerase I-like protein with 3'-5' exonuclease and polymerase domains